MNGATTQEPVPAAFTPPLRNHYSYGMLLDVFQMNLQTDYQNGKRWMLNRLVTGWGVVCGLDVQLTEDGTALVVTPGLALDPWGREIVVAAPSVPQPLPEPPAPPPDGEKDRQGRTTGALPARAYTAPERDTTRQNPEEKTASDYHIVLCYCECLTNPTVVLAPGCGDAVSCAAGTIEERYCLEIRPGRLEEFPVWECNIPDAITRGELRYDVLVRWITDSCPEMPQDPCVPLANISVRRGDGGPYCTSDDIDINVRRLALSNRALFYLQMSLLNESTPGRRGARAR
jgi:hypothetical protein